MNLPEQSPKIEMGNLGSAARHRLSLERRRILWHAFGAHINETGGIVKAEDQERRIRESLEQTKFPLPSRHVLREEYNEFRRQYKELIGVDLPAMYREKTRGVLRRLKGAPHDQDPYTQALEDAVLLFIQQHADERYSNRERANFVARHMEIVGLVAPTESQVNNAFGKIKREYKKQTGRSIRRRVKRSEKPNP